MGGWRLVSKSRLERSCCRPTVFSPVDSPSMPRVSLFVSATLAVFLAGPLCPASAPDSVVVFNEVQYNPSGAGEAGEWVELFNQLGIKTDISGWRIEGLGYTVTGAATEKVEDKS